MLLLSGKSTMLNKNSNNRRHTFLIQRPLPIPYLSKSIQTESTRSVKFCTAVHFSPFFQDLDQESS